MGDFIQTLDRQAFPTRSQFLLLNLKSQEEVSNMERIFAKVNYKLTQKGLSNNGQLVNDEQTSY